MVKITALPILATDDVDGNETLPVVKGGATMRTAGAPLVEKLAEPYILMAENAATTTLALSNFRPTFAAAIADFPIGVVFSTAETGELRAYERTSSAPFYFDLGDAVAPLTRSVMASQSGSGRVGFDRKADYPAGTAGAKLLDMPCILEDFGPATDPDDAADALADYHANGGGPLAINRKYHLPVAGGPFDIGPGPVDVGEDGALEGEIYMGPDRRVRSRLLIDYDNGAEQWKFTLGRKWQRPFEEREDWLDGGSIDDRLNYQAIDLTTVRTLTWDATISDMFEEDAPASVTATAIGYNLTNDGLWHITEIPVQGGMEVSAVMPGNNPSGNRAAFILTTQGFEYVQVPENTGGQLIVKHAGAAAGAPSAISWFGQADHQSYQAQNSEWTIRAVQGRKYAVLFNGVEIVPTRDLQVAGDIIAVGFGHYGAAAASVSTEFATRVFRREQTGKSGFYGEITGNSTSAADIHGYWQPWMEECIDGSLGLKLLAPFVNRATSGNNSAQIAAQIELTISTGLANVCVIGAPEINDIQQGAAFATTLGNIMPRAAALRDAGIKPILVIGTLWYSQLLAGFKGKPTTNYEAGARHRAALRRQAAALGGVHILDLQQLLGPIIATLLDRGDITDPVLRDNIHWTAYCYRLVGRAIAKAVLRAMCVPMTPRLLARPFPTHAAYSWFDAGNGWSNFNASYSLSDEGRFSLRGSFLNGDLTDGTALARLPAAYAPLELVEFPVMTSAGWAVMRIDTSGTMSIYGAAGTGATFVRVEGVSWWTALALKAGSGGAGVP